MARNHGGKGAKQPVFYSRKSFNKSTLPADSVTEYEAIGGGEATEPTSSLAALVAIALISGIANGYNGFVLEGALPRLRAVSMISSSLEAGVLGAALSMGGFLGSLACTAIAYLLSRRSMVVIGEVVIIVSVAAFALAPVYEVGLLGRICTGFGVGICGLAKPLIVSEQSPPKHRGLLVSLFAVGQSVGLNIFYVVDWLLPPLSVPWAWRALVGLGATPAIIVTGLALSGWSAPPSAYWDVSPSRAAAEKQLARQAAEATQRSAGEEAPSLCTLLAEPFEVRRNFGLILALMLGYNLSGTLVIANFAGDLFSSAGAGGRTLPIVIGAVQFLGLLSAAWATDRVGRRPLLLWSCALTSVCLFAVAALIGLRPLLSPVLGDLHTPILLMLMAAVEYAVGAGLNPVRIVLSAELMPNRYRSLGMSLGNALGWGLALLSLFFFPVLTSLLGGPAPQFAFFGAVVAALLALLIVYLPETRGIDFS